MAATETRAGTPGTARSPSDRSRRDYHGGVCCRARREYALAAGNDGTPRHQSDGVLSLCPAVMPAGTREAGTRPIDPLQRGVYAPLPQTIGIGGFVRIIPWLISTSRAALTLNP